MIVLNTNQSTIGSPFTWRGGRMTASVNGGDISGHTLVIQQQPAGGRYDCWNTLNEIDGRDLVYNPGEFRFALIRRSEDAATLRGVTVEVNHAP